MIKDLKRLLRVFTFDDINDTVTIGKPAIFSSTISLPDISVEVGDLALASAKLIVGNVSGKAAAVSASGDVTCDNAGAVTIGAKKVLATMVALADGKLLIGGAGGASAEQTPTGDVTISNTGATLIGASKVLTAMIAAKNVTAAKTTGIVLGYVTPTAPAVADVDRYVTSTVMKVGAYTIANASPPDGLCRNVTINITMNVENDTMGTVDIVGTDYDDAALLETITPVAGGQAVGTKAFKTITSATGVDWITGGTDDNITIGFGDLIGMPVIIPATTDFILVAWDTGVINAPTVAVGAGVGQCTVALGSAGDGTKILRVLYQI